MKKRKAMLSAVCILAGIISVSSSCTEINNNIKNEPVVVTGHFSGQPKTLKELKSEYPYIEYRELQFTYNSNNVLPMALSEQLPTMYSVPFTDSQMIINAGCAGNVTDVLKKYGYDKLTDKKYLDLVYKDGEYYGLPVFVYNMGLMCNVSVFKEAGLTDEEGYPIYPKTYDELAETASLIKKRTGKPGFFFATTQNQGGWLFMNIAWSYGVDFVKEADGRKTAAFNTPECVEALQYVKDLKWKYDALQDEIYGDSGDMINRYKDNGVGMNFFASSELDRYVSKGWPKENIAVYRNPAGPAGRYSVQGGTVWMFNKDITDEQAEACFLMINKLHNPRVDEENEKKIDEKTKNAAEQGYAVGYVGENVWNSPGYDEMVKKSQEKYANVDLKLFEDFAEGEDVIYRMEESVNAQGLYHLLDVAIQTVLLDEKADPAELIADAAEKYQKNYLDRATE